MSSTFSLLNPSTQYTLHIQNQGVASAAISLNGIQVFGPSDFNENVATLDRAVSVSGSNTLSVELRGQPGSSLTVTLIGVDSDSPSITETANPAANMYGWNNTDVNVGFACSDETSGIAACPASTLRSSEGASQIVSGTAVDNAGNTATSSLAISIDKTPPTITASAAPAPNAAGWNNSPVTVTFSCTDALSGIASCPASIALNSEGAGLSADGTAMDKAGNIASASLSVNIDLTPPAISITSPANGATVTNSNLQLTGSVSDSLSGIATVTCNGAPANISSVSFTCNLTLVSGANTIQVQATDKAGNTANTQLAVTFGAPLVPPKALFLTPTQINLLQGQNHNVQLVGDIGQIVPGATWEVSDPTVAAVSPGTPAQITALGQGTATITASFNGLSASMTVNVYAGTSLPPGVPLWAVDPLPGNFRVNSMVRGNPLNLGDPDLFMLEGSNTLRAFTADGQQLWVTQVAAGATATAKNLPLFLPWKPSGLNAGLLAAAERAYIERSGWNRPVLQPAVLNWKRGKSHRWFLPAVTQITNIFPVVQKTVPDNNGGTINLVQMNYFFSGFPEQFYSIIRLDNSGQQTWRYDSSLSNPARPGFFDRNFAVGPDSTVYVQQQVLTAFAIANGQFIEGFNSTILALDNATGQVKFTAQMPPGHFTLSRSTGTSTFPLADVSLGAVIGPLSVMPDGSVQTLVQTKFYNETDAGNVVGCATCEIAVSEQNKLELLTLQPDGSSSRQPVNSFNFNASGCDPMQNCGDPGSFYDPGEVIPDGQGGVLASWTGNDTRLGITGQNNFQAVMQHINNVGAATDYTVALPTNQWTTFVKESSLVLGDNNTAFGTDGFAIVAFDPNTGAQKWNFNPGGQNGAQMLLAPSNGGLFALGMVNPTFGDPFPTGIVGFDASGNQTTTLPLSNVTAVAYFDPNDLMASLQSGAGELLPTPQAIQPDPLDPWDFPGGPDNLDQRGPGPIRILKVLHNRAVVGSTINLVVQVAGFGKSPTLILGQPGSPDTDLAISDLNFDDTVGVITADVQVAANAKGGPVPILVQSGTRTSAPNSKFVFFVQIPKHLQGVAIADANGNQLTDSRGYGTLQIVNNGNITTLPGTVLATNSCGVYRNYAFQIMDQDSPPQPIRSVISVTELLTPSCTSPGCSSQNIQSNSDGIIPDIHALFHDSPQCLGPDEHKTLNQSFIFTVGDQSFTGNTLFQVQNGNYNGVPTEEVTTITP
ncbi:MAG TPA: Ig-like domain-containing protein [Candidatus Angelobacter sp.]|nr:Ig-like domain-containing protein [Candidatus Angelobacter sp.]